MSRIRIKVCGMKYQDNIESIASLEPDFMGFIFYNRSQRYVSKDFDPGVLEVLPSSVKRVGVFVNENAKTVLEIKRKYGLDLVQLHGNESPGYCAALSQEVGIIKALRVGSPDDLEKAKVYENSVKYFLFDSLVKNSYGGTGVKFDWNLLAGFTSEIPLFLSGGIGPGDLEDIQKIDWPGLFAIDVNSGFEMEPGVKNVNEVGKAIKHLRKA